MRPTNQPKLTTFLAFPSGAEEALNLYVSLFDDGKILNVIRARAGEPGWKEGTLQHAVFTIGGQPFMCINMPGPGAAGHDHVAWDTFSFGRSMALFIQCKSEEELDRMFAALAEGGEILMPPASYGFSARFGMVIDRFGVSWRLNLSRDVA